jgi:hypothetical protein
VADDVRADVLDAIYRVTQADPAGWRTAVERACQADLASADLAATGELRERIRSQGITATGMVTEIAHGALALSAAAMGGPFECSAFLFELAIRRALAEPGCTEFVDVRELVYAGTQCAGMLDIHDALLPPGWGWVIHGSLPAE